MKPSKFTCSILDARRGHQDIVDLLRSKIANGTQKR